jgi:hypothetical protein
MARTSSKAIIASPAAVRLNDPEVAMLPLLNLFSAPAAWRCILTLSSVAAHSLLPLSPVDLFWTEVNQ